MTAGENDTREKSLETVLTNGWQKLHTFLCVYIVFFGYYYTLNRGQIYKQAPTEEGSKEGHQKTVYSEL